MAPNEFMPIGPFVASTTYKWVQSQRVLGCVCWRQRQRMQRRLSSTLQALGCEGWFGSDAFPTLPHSSPHFPTLSHVAFPTHVSLMVAARCGWVWGSSAEGNRTGLQLRTGGSGRPFCMIYSVNRIQSWPRGPQA